LDAYRTRKIAVDDRGQTDRVTIFIQTVYWILAASKGWIKQTYRKIMDTQNTQNHIAGNDLVEIE